MNKTMYKENKESLRDIWERREEHPKWGKVTDACPLFCTQDTLNRILPNIALPKRHEGFL